MPRKKAAQPAAPAKGKAKATAARATNSRANTKKTAANTKVSADKVKKPTAPKAKSKGAASKAAAAKSNAANKKTKSSTAASARSSKAGTPAATSASASRSTTKGKSTNTAAAQPKKTSKAASKKRARTEEKEEEPKEQPVPKRPAALKRPGATINDRPVEKLKVYVFGEGSSGELGLGHMNSETRKVIDVKRPRLNTNLLPEDVGVVQVSTGGMHVVALTHDNKILTWGVNDQGSLGRSTKSGEQFKSIDADDSEDDEDLDSGLNPLEAKPAEADYINVPEGTIFTKVAAGDSVTMALTSYGLVYGCGTFRSNEGVLGFSKEVFVQETLAPIPRLRQITDIVCGANHVLALDKKGNVFAFGAGQQCQLGRRIVERTMLNGLTPSEFGLPRGKVEWIGTGAYHSFAKDKSGDVWAWGSNAKGETGIEGGVGEDNAKIMRPQRVENLKGKNILSIAGGNQHTVAATGDGEILFWGRCDGAQAGMDLDDIPESNFFETEEESEKKRIVEMPTALPSPKGVQYVAASSDHNLAVTQTGKAYSWGFSENYQTGLGVLEDVEEATLIENNAIKDEKIVWAGAGGQYSMLASVAMEGVDTRVPDETILEPQVNGTKDMNDDPNLSIETVVHNPTT